MRDVTAEQVAGELKLSPLQTLTVYTLQARMLLEDMNAADRTEVRRSKRQAAYRFVSEAYGAVVPDDQLDWVPPEFAGFASRGGREQAKIFAGVATRLAGYVEMRSAALVVLAELMTFSPWDDRTQWEENQRESSLRQAASELAGLRPDDLKAATHEFDSLMKALRRKSINWGRVAAATVVGAGVGVATAGWAAPAIGAAIGGTMGLTGAAATSAGLAALGGGSLAVGGFGVAGGALLLSGVGGVAFAGAAAAGTRFSPIASRTIAAEAVKLDLIARMVLVDSPNREEKMRRVVESLQERISDMSDTTRLLVDKINTLKKEKYATEEENERLKSQIKSLKSELDEVRSATATLEVVRDRIPELAN